MGESLTETHCFMVRECFGYGNEGDGLVLEIGNQNISDCQTATVGNIVVQAPGQCRRL